MPDTERGLVTVIPLSFEDLPQILGKDVGGHVTDPEVVEFFLAVLCGGHCYW